MKAAFVHDHRFPLFNNVFYESSGFDKSFIDRYLDLFTNVKIIARYNNCLNKPKTEIRVLKDRRLEFYCIRSSKELLNLKNFKMFEKEILSCDCAIIRLPSVLGIFAEKVCRKNGIPYILEVVGCPLDSLYDFGIVNRFCGYIYSALTKRIVKRSKYTVYVTKFFLERRYPTDGAYIDCSNVTLDNYGTVDLHRRKNRIELFNAKNSVVLGTCANLEAIYKSHSDAIKVTKILNDLGYNATYQIAGGGDRTRLQAIATSLNIQDKVEFLGELKHSKVFSWIDSIDIMLHPSRQEGLCRAIIEAMSRGCPVIASDVGGIHEQILEGCIFHKGDIDTIVDIITKQNSETLKQQMEYNYQKAADYRYDVLYKRRRDFFNQFKNYVESRGKR